MKKKITKITSIILTVFILLFTIAPTYYATENKTNYEKMEPALIKKLETTADINEKLVVSVWLEDNTSTEISNNFEDSVNKLINNGTLPLMSSKGKESLNRDSQQLLLTTKRKESKKVYKEVNNNYTENISQKLNIDESDILYISTYSPNIEINLSISKIKKLSTYDNVKYIYLCNSNNQTVTQDTELSIDENQIDITSETDTTNYVQDINELMDAIGTKYLKEQNGLTGEFIKIGMIESKLPQKNSSLLSHLGNDITYDPNIKQAYYGAHPQKVASIMVGKYIKNNVLQYEAAASNASLYCTTVENVNEQIVWKERIEWLLDSGVNIINISDTIVSDQYTSYNDIAKWIDHIATQHSITVVAAVGYFGKLSPLAFCKNIITVGGVYTSLENEVYNYHQFSASAYSETGTHYPLIVAPCEVYVEGINNVSNTSTGNSFSAPLVTSMIAQLMEYDPALATNPSLVRSLVMAGAYELTSDEIAENSGTSMDRVYGAGIINAVRTYSMVMGHTNTDLLIPNRVSGNIYTFYLTHHYVPVRVALCWERPIYLDENHNEFSNDAGNSFVSLTVTSPKGNKYTVFDQNDTFQLLTFTPSPGDWGAYTISIYRNGPSNHTTPISVAVLY